MITAGIVIGVSAAAAFVAGSMANYRRYMPRPRAFGEKKYPVTIQRLPVQAGSHSLYGSIVMRQIIRVRRQAPSSV